MEKALEVVIIGGVAAGATAATKIRRESESAHITIFEKGPYVSFANWYGTEVMRLTKS